jgi:hypothetical protein
LRQWLLQQDALHVRDEAQVFEAVLNWAETDSEVRAPTLTLQGVFRAVRFSFMSTEAISKAFWRLSCIVGVTNIDPNVQSIMAAAQRVPGAPSPTDAPAAPSAPAKGGAAKGGGAVKGGAAKGGGGGKKVSAEDMGATLDMPARPYYAHQHRVVAVGGGLEASWEASKQPVILKASALIYLLYKPHVMTF